jgi:pyruvate/2-oxoacid:ferredoxin oxidoreductase alpha subunit
MNFKNMEKTIQKPAPVGTMNGSHAVVQSLLNEGVDLIFGYPGGAIMPVYDALYDYEDSLRHILTRHEQGAIHAAQGYARATGKVGVCLATSGPGATNLITGIADAQIDSTPSGLHHRTSSFSFTWNRCLPRNRCGGDFYACHQMELSGNPCC